MAFVFDCYSNISQFLQLCSLHLNILAKINMNLTSTAFRNIFQFATKKRLTLLIFQYSVYGLEMG